METFLTFGCWVGMILYDTSLLSRVVCLTFIFTEFSRNKQNQHGILFYHACHVETILGVCHVERNHERLFQAVVKRFFNVENVNLRA